MSERDVTPTTAELAAQLQRVLDSALASNEQLVVLTREAAERVKRADRRAALLTMIVAVVAILIGLAQTIFSVRYATQSNSRVVSELAPVVRRGEVRGTTVPDAPRKDLYGLRSLSRPALRLLLTFNNGYKFLSADWATNGSDAPALQELVGRGLLVVFKSDHPKYPYKVDLTEKGTAAYEAILKDWTAD